MKLGEGAVASLGLRNSSSAVLLAMKAWPEEAHYAGTQRGLAVVHRAGNRSEAMSIACYK